MRIVCPSCDATYDVPEAMLSGGPRKVRCARCANEWTPTAVTTAPLMFEAAEDEEDPRLAPHAPEADATQAHGTAAQATAEPPARAEPRLNPLRSRYDGAPREAATLMPEDAPPPPRARASAVAVVAWGLSLLVLAGLAGAALQWHDKVATAWPPSARVFAALGLR